jgi:hypothetical protein
MDSFKRNLQVALNVIAQGFEGRDVDHLSCIFESSGQSLLDEIVDGAEECGQGLARTGRSGDECVLPGFD